MLKDLLGRVLADVMALVDTPPFDRSVVDGFAVRSDDLQQASQSAPTRLTLNPETIACGTVPEITVKPQPPPMSRPADRRRAAPMPVMIEHTNPVESNAIAVDRAVSPGQNIAFAGSDIARGQILLHKGAVIGALEIGMLAAVGKASAKYGASRGSPFCRRAVSLSSQVRRWRRPGSMI